MLIYLDIKIPHLQIAYLGGNLEVENIKIHQVGGIKIVCTRARYFFLGYGQGNQFTKSDSQEIYDNAYDLQT